VVWRWEHRCSRARPHHRFGLVGVSKEAGSVMHWAVACGCAHATPGRSEVRTQLRIRHLQPQSKATNRQLLTTTHVWQMKALGALYKEMHSSVKQEVATAKAIFPHPDTVRQHLAARRRTCGPDATCPPARCVKLPRGHASHSAWCCSDVFLSSPRPDTHNNTHTHTTYTHSPPIRHTRTHAPSLPFYHSL
jgi:hypothetical protein